ncbi:winged helix family transcriptional regulator [Enterobacter hormaechei]|uniref:winged helix-turn-helix domain-containing protein n=1 Tax=Enterobacter hormaechei TaxID=158836 RepID=UPI0011DDA283|nr:winged helix-turn-helix domain-containing protein [Enterobacter hormaechei]TXU08341.1 winged helix family transcriptional regulator [Enterobacter hormaechei]
MRKIINGRVLYDSNKRELSVQDQQVVLSASVARLLDFFIINNAHQLSRELIIEEVWAKYGMNPSGHSLNKSISLLRKGFSALGIDGVIITIPREGFVFQAQINDNREDILDATEKGVTNVNHAGTFPCNKTFIVWFVFFLFVVGCLGVFLTVMFRSNDGVVHVLNTGVCEVYTMDDNSSEKIYKFLHSKRWKGFNAICHGTKRAIIFYDDNSLSKDNKLKEHFFSICMMDEKKVAYECQNYFY